MINPTGKKLQKIISKMIDDDVEGVDKYTLNGSTWLIFTDQKRWVIEYTSDNILWYNYSFFTEIFDLLSMKATDNQNLIQEWFESKFLRPQINDIECSPNPPHDHAEEIIQNGVKHTFTESITLLEEVEDTIQNGVKDTPRAGGSLSKAVEHTIQNGVKHTSKNKSVAATTVEHTIQNGVKHTEIGWAQDNGVEDTIQNGVKHTKNIDNERSIGVEDTIQNGVKETKQNRYMLNISVEEAIQNGVKETITDYFSEFVDVEDTIENGVKLTEKSLQIDGSCVIEDVIQNGVKDTKPMDEWVNAESIIEDTIEYGVKELQPLPAQDGNRDWGNYYHGKEDRTKPFNVYVDEAIIFGVKEVIKDNHHRTREVAVTIKDGVKETHQDCSNNIARVEGIIRVGEKLN